MFNSGLGVLGGEKYKLFGDLSCGFDALCSGKYLMKLERSLLQSTSTPNSRKENSDLECRLRVFTVRYRVQDWNSEKLHKHEDVETCCNQYIEF